MKSKLPIVFVSGLLGIQVASSTGCPSRAEMADVTAGFVVCAQVTDSGDPVSSRSAAFRVGITNSNEGATESKGPLEIGLDSRGRACRRIPNSELSGREYSTLCAYGLDPAVSTMTLGGSTYTATSVSSHRPGCTSTDANVDKVTFTLAFDIGGGSGGGSSARASRRLEKVLDRDPAAFEGTGVNYDATDAKQ